MKIKRPLCSRCGHTWRDHRYFRGPCMLCLCPKYAPQKQRTRSLGRRKQRADGLPIA